MILFETLIYETLVDGIAELQANPTLLERLFRGEAPDSFTDAEISKIRDVFESAPPNVTHEYPRIDTEFPCWAIVLGGENEDRQVLGDEVGVVGLGEDGGLDPSNPDAGATCLGSFWSHQYLVQTFTEHPDVTRWYYDLSKMILERKRRSFLAHKIVNVTFRGDAILPDPRYVPAHLFVRQITLSAQSTRTLVGEQEQRAFVVDGAHYADPDIVGVAANVSVVEE